MKRKEDRIVPWAEARQEFAKMALLLMLAALDWPLCRWCVATGHVWEMVAANLVGIAWCAWLIADLAAYDSKERR